MIFSYFFFRAIGSDITALRECTFMSAHAAPDELRETALRSWGLRHSVRHLPVALEQAHHSFLSNSAS